jgi:hypothetical protein
MSKNMTRKGLAIGTASALVITGLIGTPAVAGGLADKTFVSLAPSSGTAYTVVSGNGKTFSLTANEASSVAGSGRNVKFLVTDPDSAVEPTIATSARSYTMADNAVVTMTAVASSVITIADAAHTMSVGDKFFLTTTLTVDGFTDSAGGGAALTVAAAANTIFTVSAATAGTSFAFASGTNAVGQTDLSGAINGASEIAKVVREARDSAGSFVVNTGSATDTSNETLVLAQGDETTTRTVTVEAWVDANGNDEIDSTEYASPVRTVTFKKASEITGVVTWTTPTLGDTTLKASVVTTPELNGSQMSTDDVTVQFTRQGSTATLTAAEAGGSTTWDSTNKEWDATANTALSSNGTPWTGLTDTNANDVVFAGTYSARPYIGSTALAAAVSVVVGSTQADDVEANIAATANNDAGANEDGSSATAVTIRKGSSVTVTATVYDADGDAIGAGIPVTGTLSATTGTIRVNGVATSDTELTNASGVVTFVVSTTTALNSDAATFTIQAQNVSTGAKTAVYTLTWDDATTTLHDAAVANPATDVNRSVAKNGTVSFGIRILDQWKQSLSGTYRLKVANTGNTVNTSYVTVTNGAATVTVTDGQIAAGSSISTAIDVEKDVSGTWTAQDLTNDGNTDGNADTVTYTTGVLTQTDAVTLDTDASTTYGSATADDSDAIAAKKTIAVDTRSSFVAVPAYANDVVISGRVANATTAAVRAGAVVTITGTSDMLFTNGGVYSFGSITLVTDSSGEFDVSVYSNKVQKDTVVTVSSNGASATRKVTFTTGGADTGASVSFAGTPAAALPGSTFQVVMTLLDEYGNAVDATNTDVDVTYTGPGIVFGTLPADTDANGQAKFAVLLGTNDKGTATITFSYDTNNDGDYVDTGEFTTAHTVTVGSVAKVNVASFNGKLVVYAAGLNGKRISWKVGGRWGKAVASSNYAVFNRPTPVAGATVSVDVYVDGVKTLTKSVVTR